MFKTNLYGLEAKSNLYTIITFKFQLKTIEARLNEFLKEVDETVAWITDTELLLKPLNPKKELIVVRLFIGGLFFYF